MSNPRDDDETLGRVYQGLRDTSYAADEGNRSRTAASYLAFVRAYRRPPGRLLDLGCATGIFAGLAHVSGWQATGVDASGSAIHRARERRPGPVFIDDACERVAFPAQFDVATMWDVLEHVGSPAAILSRVHGWVVNGGFLFLNVPNVESAVARAMGRRWVLLLREHVWYFSPATIERLLWQAGFEMLDTRPNRVRFSPAAIARRVAQYDGPIGRAAERLASNRWLERGAMTFPIGEMRVVARKR